MRKIPMRKCVATQEQLTKKELIQMHNGKTAFLHAKPALLYLYEDVWTKRVIVAIMSMLLEIYTITGGQRHK